MLFRRSDSSLTVHTPAKLNLFLEVLNKRTDGFHELETVMVMVNVYDQLRLRSVPESDRDTSRAAIKLCVFSVNEPSQTQTVPTGDDNLIVKAARLLQERTGTDQSAEIDLWKRIPSEAGMAGGSSDAAATLAGLNQLWDLNVPQNTLLKLAAELGSDVAFFLSNTEAALCTGRGEKIEPLAVLASLYFVIVKPDTGLSTPAVFKHWKPSESTRSAQTLVHELKRGATARLGNALHNALQQPAEELNPVISHVRNAFSNEPVLGHMMSGSGTSYFGLCRHRRHAERVAARLSSRRIGRVIVARSQF